MDQVDPLRMCAHDVAMRGSAIVDEALPLANMHDVHNVDWHEVALSALERHYAALGELLDVWRDTVAARRAQARAGAA